MVSDEFEGMNIADRHKLIFKLLDEEFKMGLHALTLSLKTTKEFEKSPNKPFCNLIENIII